MKYNKLVRDKIPKIIRQKGGKPITHRADEKEYWQKLKEKLTEEVDEFLESESIDELVDVLEVIDAIGKVRTFDQKEVAELKEKRRQERGGFEEKIILEES